MITMWRALLRWTIGIVGWLCHFLLGWGQEVDLRSEPPKGFPYRYLSQKSLGNPHATLYVIEFPSPLVTPYEENNQVRGWWLVPADRIRFPVVILLHSWGIRHPDLEMGLAHELLRHGIGVLLLTLPYHMSRTPAGGYDSGELMVQPDTAHLRRTMGQTVLDVKRAIDWLERRPEVDKTRLGLAGISLGAIASAVVLGVEPRIQSAVLILGGADLAHILWRSPLTIRTRLAFKKQRYTLEKLREELEPIEPLQLLKPELGMKSFVIGARFDLIVPAEDTEKLIKALGQPQVLWLDTGHFGGALVQRALFRIVRRYFVSRFEGLQPELPQHVLAPTLRIGAIYGAERGLRIALGVDLWRSDSRGRGFVAGVLTPRGTSLFAGIALKGGFSAGVEITPRHLSGSLFWHFVL